MVAHVDDLYNTSAGSVTPTPSVESKDISGVVLERRDAALTNASGGKMVKLKTQRRPTPEGQTAAVRPVAHGKPATEEENLVGVPKRRKAPRRSVSEGGMVLKKSNHKKVSFAKSPAARAKQSSESAEHPRVVPGRKVPDRASSDDGIVMRKMAQKSPKQTPKTDEAQTHQMVPNRRAPGRVASDGAVLRKMAQQAHSKPAESQDGHQQTSPQPKKGRMVPARKAPARVSSDGVVLHKMAQRTHVKPAQRPGAEHQTTNKRTQRPPSKANQQETNSQSPPTSVPQETTAPDDTLTPKRKAKMTAGPVSANDARAPSPKKAMQRIPRPARRTDVEDTGGSNQQDAAPLTPKRKAKMSAAQKPPEPSQHEPSEMDAAQPLTPKRKAKMAAAQSPKEPPQQSHEPPTRANKNAQPAPVTPKRKARIPAAHSPIPEDEAVSPGRSHAATLSVEGRPPSPKQTNEKPAHHDAPLDAILSDDDDNDSVDGRMSALSFASTSSRSRARIRLNRKKTVPVNNAIKNKLKSQKEHELKMKKAVVLQALVRRFLQRCRYAAIRKEQADELKLRTMLVGAYQLSRHHFSLLEERAASVSKTSSIQSTTASFDTFHSLDTKLINALGKANHKHLREVAALKQRMEEIKAAETSELEKILALNETLDRRGTEYKKLLSAFKKGLEEDRADSEFRSKIEERLRTMLSEAMKDAFKDEQLMDTMILNTIGSLN